MLSNRLFQLGFGLTLALSVGCAKVGVDTVPAGNPEIDPATVSGTTDPTGDKNPHSCVQTGEKCFTETFKQPTQNTKAVDVLFVVQTSSSISAEIQSVTSGINSFISSLPAGSDYNIAVMLSHGSTSARSGRLFQAGEEPIVLKSSELSNDNIQSYLTNKLTHLVADPDAGGGEEGLFSLFNGITTPSLLAESQNEDFFRANAALSIVFIADRRDICAVVPSGVADETDAGKMAARIRDCEGLTAAGLTNRLTLLKGAMPLAVSGIIYADEPAPTGNEIGYGYTDVINLNAGVAIDIANDNIADGLSSIAELSGDQMQVTNVFALDHDDVDTSTIKVTVNGEAATFTFDGTKVTVTSKVPAGATVVIDYCLNQKHDCKHKHHGHRRCCHHSGHQDTGNGGDHDDHQDHDNNWHDHDDHNNYNYGHGHNDDHNNNSHCNHHN